MGDRKDLPDAAWHVLRTAPWLEGCEDAVVDQLALASRLQKVPAGTVVATRGQTAQHLIVVAEGAIEVGMTNAAGKRHVTSWLGRGQLLGLIPVLENGPMIHTATAVRPSRLLLLTRAALLQALQDHPSLALRLIYLVCRRARTQYEALAAQSLLTLPMRLMRVLLGQLQDHPDGRILVTQADLADVLGVTRQSLNQELRKLEREGLIQLGRGHITVLDRSALVRGAGGVE
ncbi:Crp/Fnr family transcriptional regulator [Pigmentiphaga sp.]|uniref:Crp/Fnr family transcriptional regulator n=1 Tax=Pigmentiphaga sp. TaxID=1977564 RepID=UPI0025F6F329|nr:Crp/Fnr family transcriptional regulator [Pigmentiphaga sp.]